jgi:quercetin dioxygenase-like cupin family protein
MSKEIDKRKSNEVSINSREKILEFERTLISAADGVNIEGDGKHVMTESKIAPIKHTFADGVYIRQMDMAKGTVVVGAIHKHLHVWFLLAGDVTVATEDTTEDYIAPCYVLSTPGAKRVILANEDSIFVNVHKNPSNTQDIDELEKEIVALSYEEYEEYTNKKK